jgi:hypothetical protein
MNENKKVRRCLQRKRRENGVGRTIMVENGPGKSSWIANRMSARKLNNKQLILISGSD